MSNYKFEICVELPLRHFIYTHSQTFNIKNVYARVPFRNALLLASALKKKNSHRYQETAILMNYGKDNVRYSSQLYQKKLHTNFV